MGIAKMTRWLKSFATIAAVAAPLVAIAEPAAAGIGDLLVAPTRVVLDGRKGSEIILNNIGEEPATYRVSVEFRRMTPDGGLADVTDPTPQHKAAEDMIVYQPRKVTLAPREPQSIRIVARPGKDLPDGEYRVHMLFRAIPQAAPAAKPSDQPAKGVQFQIRPIYGVTIPVIVRHGNLQATASISNVHMDRKDGKAAVALDLSRSGSRSTFGDIRVLKAGVKEPIAIQKAVAVYTEINSRHLTIPLDENYKGQITGPVTVQYVETSDSGPKVIAEAQAVLR